MRPRNGAKPIDMSIVRKALEDKRMWCGLAVVVKRENENQHFEIVQEDGGKVDVFVEIDLMPEEIPVTARLGSFGGGQGTGAWRIPPVGTEVAWMAPMGQVNADIMIVGTLSSREVPGALDEDTFIIVNPGRVIMASKDDKVYLGSEDGTGTKPAARKDDGVGSGTIAFSHAPTGALVVTYTPGDGSAVQTVTNTGTLTLKEKIIQGSADVEIK